MRRTRKVKAAQKKIELGESSLKGWKNECLAKFLKKRRKKKIFQ
jgi:hypothetical protein